MMEIRKMKRKRLELVVLTKEVWREKNKAKNFIVMPQFYYGNEYYENITTVLKFVKKVIKINN